MTSLLSSTTLLLKPARAPSKNTWNFRSHVCFTRFESLPLRLSSCLTTALAAAILSTRIGPHGNAAGGRSWSPEEMRDYKSMTEQRREEAEQHRQEAEAERQVRAEEQTQEIDGIRADEEDRRVAEE